MMKNIGLMLDLFGLIAYGAYMIALKKQLYL